MTTTRRIRSHTMTYLPTGRVWFNIVAGRTRYHAFTGSDGGSFKGVELFRESPQGLVNIPAKAVSINATIPRLNRERFALIKGGRYKGTLEWTT